VVSYWSLCLLLLPVVTLFGNALVCLSVCTERGLHTATNYFIVSLAIADIMVAILVMPLAVYVEVSKLSIVKTCMCVYMQTSIRPGTDVAHNNNEFLSHCACSNLATNGSYQSILRL